MTTTHVLSRLENRTQARQGHQHIKTLIVNTLYIRDNKNVQELEEEHSMGTIEFFLNSIRYNSM